MPRPVKQRPLLCPCPVSCTPIRNEFIREDDSQVQDLTEGISGECYGRASQTREFIVGGIHHKNTLNHCIFTPLKGVLQFQECEGDLESYIMLANRVLQEINPIQCTECGGDRVFSRFVFLGMNNPVLCEKCAVRLRFLQWSPDTRKYRVCHTTENSVGG